MYKILGYIKNKIKRFLINKPFVKESFLKISYSQEGEDLILNRIFENQENGFYIDVGAHHPRRFSNTYLFYKKGWRGVNIDAMPGSMELFKKERPYDVNLEIAVAKESKDLTFYIFNEKALNTFSKIQATKKNHYKNFRIVEEKIIKAYPFMKIAQEYSIDLSKVDFLSIDVEGLDEEVVESIDFGILKPKVILIELEKEGITNVTNSKIYKLLIRHDYVFFAKTYNTSFFVLPTVIN